MINKYKIVVSLFMIVILGIGIVFANEEKENRDMENNIFLQVCCIPSEFEIYNSNNFVQEFNLPVRVQVYNETLRPFRNVLLYSSLGCDDDNNNSYYSRSKPKFTKSSGVVLFKYRVSFGNFTSVASCVLEVFAEGSSIDDDGHVMSTSYYQRFRVHY